MQARANQVQFGQTFTRPGFKNTFVRLQPDLHGDSIESFSSVTVYCVCDGYLLMAINADEMVEVESILEA